MEITYPKTIDISLTGQCQLNCAWCWGEEHFIGTTYEADKWKSLLNKYHKIGVKAVVFTGGEPLISPILPEIIKYVKEDLSMRTTLSTNGILLGKFHNLILPWIDDIGLPLDGSTQTINKSMRAGNIDNFQNVLDGIALILNTYPKIDLTLRTVIARPNVNDIVNIPQTIINNGIDLSLIRYKLYQVEPIGPRANTTRKEEWKVEEEECRLIKADVEHKYPNLSVTLQLYRETSGRYYQVGPRGNAYGTLIDKLGNPHMVELGNPMIDFEKSVDMIKNKYYFHSTH